MAIMQPVTLTWAGKEYIVAADKVMRLIAVVEDQISLGELLRDKGAPLAKLASAYAAALTYAGCKVAADDVYSDMFAGDAASKIAEHVGTLLGAMIPPEHLRSNQTPASDAQADEGNGQAS